ncbi:MAG TPA: glyceraldehyde 3-phosphate dehydrogenase NAD-binding domain-containing protein, partial [Candidatus Paceibacterota bacterium]
DVENLAYLLKYDTVYGRFPHNVSADRKKNELIVDKKRIKVLQVKDPSELPWKNMKIDIAVEVTGLFESFEASRAHLKAGAKRVVLGAPAKDGEGRGRTVLVGINEQILKKTRISSNASCTTNSVAPVMEILSKAPGIAKAFLGTVHAQTTTQNLADGPVRGGKDYRRGRAAGHNIAPSTTGAAIAVTRVIPKLKDKFDGLAYRVPIITGSMSDITFIAKRNTSVEEINRILTKASRSARWKGILKVTNDQIVSSDIVGEPYGAIVDLSLTKVVDGNLVKVISWYDNEYGYVSTLIRHLQKSAKLT